MILFLPLLAAIAPLLIWPIELLFPYPHLIEELVKTLLIVPLLDDLKKSAQVKMIILLGFLFALSESVLYLFNISVMGNLKIFFSRLLITIPLHTITLFLIFLPTMKNKKLIILPGRVKCTTVAGRDWLRSLTQSKVYL